LTNTTKKAVRDDALKVVRSKSSTTVRDHKAKAMTTTKPRGHGKHKTSTLAQSGAAQKRPTNTGISSLPSRQKLGAKPRVAGAHKPLPKPRFAAARHPTAKQPTKIRTDQKSLVSDSHAAKTAPQQAVHPHISKTVEKHVSFFEGPIKPHFYSLDDTIQLSAYPDESASHCESGPVVGLLHSRVTPTGSVTTQLFQSTSTGCVTLKRRFVDRFASVQAYEKRRREDALAKGEQPGLGQLDYGNAVIKIALQASEVIAVHDIGML
jgi:hypothetical protein